MTYFNASKIVLTQYVISFTSEKQILSEYFRDLVKFSITLSVYYGSLIVSERVFNVPSAQ